VGRPGVTDRLHDLADTARTLSVSCSTIKALNTNRDLDDIHEAVDLLAGIVATLLNELTGGK